MVHAHDRSFRWYVTGGIVVLLTVIYGIVSGTWTLSLAALLVGGMYYLLRNAQTPLRHMVIEQDGFTLEGTFTPWHDCDGFWLIHTPLYTELRIRRAKGFDREAVIQTGHIDPTEIRRTLSQFLPIRADRQEKLVDACIRFCKL